MPRNHGGKKRAGKDRGSDDGYFFQRRELLKLVTAITACGATHVVGGHHVLAQNKLSADAQPLDAPSNSLAPAVHFQAAPGGTAALLEQWAKTNGGKLPVREQINVAPWVGQPPSKEEEIAFLPVHRLAALIQSGKISPVQLTEIYLDRLKRLDAKLLCMVTLMEESARRQALRAEQEIKQGDYRGPLHGIPWGVKDLFSTKGVVTTWGAKPYESRVIDEDAQIVVRLRDAGAILIAKLSSGTFAQGDQWYRGRTRNPWNTTQGSSGSSAGPASATAAGCVAFAIGTETRGSIVSPARRCGMSALRPTFGRVSRHGCMTLSWSMDKVGPMCRTIEDCALVFHVIHGADEKDPSTLTAPFHFDRSPDLARMNIGYTQGTDEAFLEKLRELGARPRQLPDRPDYRSVRDILNAESAAAFDAFLRDHLDEQMVRKSRVEGFRKARSITALDYLNSQRRRFALMQEMAQFMDGLDMYVSSSGDVGLTNLTGHPAVVVPHKLENGQPQCITLIGDPFADDKILSVAHAYQTATAWHRQHPRVEDGSGN